MSRTVVPRRYAYCMECRENTVQWLHEVRVGGRGGCFRGQRLLAEYKCRDCGEVNV